MLKLTHLPDSVDVWVTDLEKRDGLGFSPRQLPQESTILGSGRSISNPVETCEWHQACKLRSHRLCVHQYVPRGLTIRILQGSATDSTVITYKVQVDMATTGSHNDRDVHDFTDDIIYGQDVATGESRISE